MYTATMRYQPKPEHFEAALDAWKRLVLEEAKKAEGLVRMQLLRGDNVFLAIGTWMEKSFAETFMQTGVFKTLTQEIDGMLVEKPLPELWKLDAFFQA
ncbi:MAG TPA: antibiotic biosynthesis monooxygenase [Treponemataceae bacterium]|jgi:quinol monooxygenase YgiN|nr:hypothetical protein [Treponema sp.]HOS36369.1 antibiotic biosynthesis monooxygenase [Treponemataceae bacterium]HOU39462.1 antibiotic biosynthesis monooxygenase [Treponemataceae bacterium]HPA11383.1 antibiotic biosynthesis monooxygenase [Treponemataceae bacterium]HPL92185.1 antibiotic biosynthesis monooxygenase [Treponemataceae bacterium]